MVQQQAANDNPESDGTPQKNEWNIVFLVDSWPTLDILVQVFQFQLNLW